MQLSLVCIPSSWEVFLSVAMVYIYLLVFDFTMLLFFFFWNSNWAIGISILLYPGDFSLLYVENLVFCFFMI